LSKTFEAVYEGGVFRPTKRVDLPEGTRVLLRVEAVSPSGITSFTERFVGLLAEHGVKIKEDPLKVLLRMRER